MTDETVHKYGEEARRKFDNARRSYKSKRKYIEKYIDDEKKDLKKGKTSIFYKK